MIYLLTNGNMQLKVHHYTYLTEQLRVVLNAFCDRVEQTPGHFCINREGGEISCVPINDYEELYCLKIFVNEDPRYEKDYKDVIPGVHETCLLWDKNLNPGSGFIWNVYNDYRYKEHNFLFVGSFLGDSFAISHRYEVKHFFPSKYIHERYTDNRLVKVGNDIYIHDTCMSYLALVTVDQQNHEIDINFSSDQTDKFNTNLALVPSQKSNYYRKYIEDQESQKPTTSSDADKNLTLLEYNQDLRLSLVLHWFQKGHVTGLLLHEDKWEHFNLVPMLKDQLPTTDWHPTLPNFSLSTQALDLHAGYRRPDLYEWEKLGRGHVKIRTPDHKYLPGSRIHKFERETKELFYRLFGEKYREYQGRNWGNMDELCYGYMYLSYFYIFRKRKDGTFSMHISDAFLPIDVRAESKDQYKFTLLESMGMFKKTIAGREYVCLTYGEGEYYVSIQTHLEGEILQACKHDVSHFNGKEFDYHLSLFGEQVGSTPVLETLTPPLEQSAKKSKLSLFVMIGVLVLIGIVILAIAFWKWKSDETSF